MTEREYIEALVQGMREQLADAEERVKTLKPSAARRFNEEQRARSLQLLDSLEPPEELRALHARLRQMAEASVDQHEVEDPAVVEDILRLAAIADSYGLELVPGMNGAQIAELVGSGGREWAPLDDGWEARLRRSLSEDGREDIDGIVERMRELRRNV